MCTNPLYWHCLLYTSQPIQFEPLTDDLSKELKESCKPGLMPMAGIKVHPSGCVMPEEFKIYAERLKKFTVYDDDTWVISYPKCGKCCYVVHTYYTITSLSSP